MADKQVVRQDVVQITWDINDDPMKELIRMMKEFKKVGKDAQGSVQRGWKSVVNGANSVKKALTPLNNKINAIGKSFARAFGNVAKKAILGVGAALTAIGGIAIKNYAAYEQLVGGVETLFKDSDSIVMKNANEAYKTAGLSANAYMETVTGFSASLLQSLGGDTKKAASYANIAVTDMSDNANKMGTSMESIQNAYQGFAKQNYTMLDNLKLGYGGTKEEMNRLINDAAKLDKSVKKNDMSFGNIVLAINAVQKEMGIYGTTSKEASSTIQGSISAMNAAWTNFTVGLADPNQDLDALMTNLIDSVVTAAKNIIPRIAAMLPTLLSGVSDLVRTLAFKAKEYLIANKGQIWEGFKTMMAEGMSTFSELFTGEGMDIESIKTKIEDIKNKAVELVNAFKDNWPAIKTAIIGVVTAIGLLKGAMLICNTIIGINNAIMKTKQAIDLACAAKAKVLAAAQWLVNTSIMGCPVIWIIAAIVALIAIIVLLVKNWDKVKAAGEKCWEAIKTAWGKASAWLDEKVVQPIKDAFQGAWDFVTELWGGITDFFSGLWDGIKNIVSKITGKASEAKGDADKVKKSGNPRKYASGGLITKPHLGLVGEAGPEMVIPLTDRKRGLALLAQTARMLTGSSRSVSSSTPTNYPRSSYSPSTGASRGKQSYSENNTYAPSFTLNFTGTTDRAAERIIKQWVMEALNDTFDSMGRTSPRLTEV